MRSNLTTKLWFVGQLRGQQANFEPEMFCRIKCLQLQCNSPRLHQNFCGAKILEQWKLEIGTIDTIQCGLLIYCSIFLRPALCSQLRASQPLSATDRDFD